MAKRTPKRKKGSQKLSKGTYYTLIVILLILITAAIYYSTTSINRTKPIATTTATEQTSADTLKQKEIIKQPKADSLPKSNKKAKKSFAIGAKVLELPFLKDSIHLFHNKNGRYRVQYSPKNKIPLFVSYILTRKESKRNIVKRSDSFTPDPHYLKLDIELASDSDYRRSGYDRGHLLPSADRNDSEIENLSTFHYSNIAPQLPALNRGTMNALEQKIREWAIKYDSLHIVTGSILNDNSNRPTQKIGKGVAVPQYFYKVIAVKHKGSYKTIGFIMPNIESIDPDYKKYMVSVDQIEEISSENFFHILPDYVETRVEKEVDSKFWS